MKWVKEDVRHNKQVWYSEDVIERIKGKCNYVAYACHCDNCDGVGYYEGCKDTECGTYQALQILEFLNEVENESTEDKK